MKNFIQHGSTMSAVAPTGGVTSGQFVKIGALCGVAANAAEQGASVELVTKGVFKLPKATGSAWVAGERLFWDAVAGKFTNDPTDYPVSAFALEAAGTGDTEGVVALGFAGGGLKTVAGQHTTVTAADTVVTGLAKVVSVVASFETDPADPNTYVSAQVGDQAGAPDAGSVIIKTWKQTGTDPTPVAADAFAKKVNWIAVGL